MNPWRPCLTFWITVWKREAAIDDWLGNVRADISPNATELRTSKANGLVHLSYRLREDTSGARVPSLYAFVITARGHVQLGIYADREEDIAAAQAVLASVRHLGIA